MGFCIVFADHLKLIKTLVPRANWELLLLLLLLFIIHTDDAHLFSLNKNTIYCFVIYFPIIIIIQYSFQPKEGVGSLDFS